jgi:predicted phage terminase large subunit-like protein
VPAEASTVVHSWDTAYKADQINDPSVCTVWHLGRGAPGYYLRDVFRERMEYPALRRAVVNLARRDNPAAILIEDKASGQSLIQDLRNSTTLPIIPIEPAKDKETRMFAASASFEAGLVQLPESAAWVLDYEIELTTFPLAPHDDRVDSTSQFLNWVRGWGERIDSAGAGLLRTMADEMSGEQETSDAGYGSIGSGTDITGY